MRLPVSYSLRNLSGRPLRSLMTLGGVALVVVACSLLLGLLSSFRRTLTSTGHPLNLVVLRKGSGSDASSMLSLEAYQAIRYLEGIAHDAEDRPLASPELVVQPLMQTREGKQESIVIRGVEPIALGVHNQVRITEGRMLEPSSREIILGRALVGRYAGAVLGGELAFGRGRWKVVGIFDAEGSSFESEVWADVREIANDAMRPVPFSGVRLRATGPEALSRLEEQIDADPRHGMEADRELNYYAEQSKPIDALYALLVGIAMLAGVGAGFGAANTMYSAVQARTGEIGTLRALGFSRGAIIIAFEVEATALAMAGFAFGAVSALVLGAAVGRLAGGIAIGTQASATSVIALRLTAFDLGAVFALALAIGLGGGLGPAWRAARLRPVEALRRQ